MIPGAQGISRRRHYGRSIFQRIWVRPGQLRTVADRRFDDAQCLRVTNDNARANGAMYLGGFVVECLLKAKLLEKYRWLQSVRAPHGLSHRDQHVWSLCYRSHDLDEILDHLPEVTGALRVLEQKGQPRLTQAIKRICAQWTIFARYSPQTASIAEANDFLDSIGELKPWLR